MINIKIVCVGTLKESYWVSAIQEYSKRLKAFCAFNIIEVKESLEGKSEAEILKQKYQEAKLLEKHKSDYNIALEINGQQLASTEFAKKIEEISLKGNSSISFFIGGSNGLDKQFSDSLDYKMSFGKLTYPHQLMRVVLTEQIYRAFMIINNRSYHK